MALQTEPSRPAVSSTLDEDAIVLRRIEFGDSSLILRLLTRTHGIVTALAKGAHREKGPWLGMLDLPFWLRVQVNLRSTREIQLLTGASLQGAFPRIRSELSRFYLALYAIELAEEAGQPADAGEIFEMFRNFLAALDSQEVRPGTLWIHFELVFLAACGLRPALLQCASCGEDLTQSRESLFSPADGGALCGRCHRPSATAILRVPCAALTTADKLAQTPIARIGRISIAPELLRQIQRALDGFLQYHWGRVPRTRNLMDHLLH